MNSSQGADRTDFNNRQSNKSTIFANSPSVDERNPYKSGETLVTINRYRTTSAEMISEAKKYLNKMTTHGPNPNALPSNAAGVQVINTKRPITPRETGRSLYGKVSLAGRPPSAFSMKYLQNENPSLMAHRAHTLEPISQQTDEKFNESHVTSNIRRSQSWELSPENLLLDRNRYYPNSRRSMLPHKLPALQLHGKSFNRLDPIASVPEEARPHTVANEDGGGGGGSSTDSFRTIDGLLDILQQHRGIKESNSQELLNRLNMLLVELYDRVNGRERCFRQPTILGALYGLVECDSPKILLAIARVILALRTTGSNLAGACKLVFKVAKNSENDCLFHENDVLELLIDGLGRASPLEDPEICIYGYGAIRFLTCNTKEERDALNADVNNTVRPLESLNLPPKPSTAPDFSSSSIYGPENLSTKSSISKKGRSDHLYRIGEKLDEQNNLVTRLAKHGAVQLIILHLQILNEYGAVRKLAGLPLHALYQLSATLRALADIRYYAHSTDDDSTDVEKRAEAVTHMDHNNSIQLELACPHLVKAAEITLNEIEIQANIIRTLSVLSDDEDCCRVLAKFAPRIGILLAPCCTNLLQNKSSEKSLSLVSRLGYILGNIMAKYDNARSQFFQNDVAMEYLQRVLEIYSKLPLSLHNSLGDTVIDALVKIIRVVANMSVNAEVGIALGRNDSLQLIFLQLLKASSSTAAVSPLAILTQAKQIKLKMDLEELFHVILGALHNLFFYQDEFEESQYSGPTPLNDTIRGKMALNLCLALRNQLQDRGNHIAIQLEIVRVLGNLTRNTTARKQFCEANGIDLILELLQHILLLIDQEQNDFKACIIGILINILGDTENRLIFGQSKGVEILLDVLRDALESYPIQDWFLASIVCQAFWNLYNDAKHLNVLCSLNNNLDELIELLMKYIDEEKFVESVNIRQGYLEQQQKQTPEESLQTWQSFTVVATDLLEHLQNFLNHSTLPLNRDIVDMDNSSPSCGSRETGDEGTTTYH